MRRTKENTEVTRQSILDAAIKVFTRLGYANTRLEDVAVQAGVTRGAIYHHFGGKVELYTALTQERFDSAMQGVTQIMQDGLSTRTTIERLIVYSLELLENDALYRAVQELSFFKTAYAPELEALMEVKSENIKKLFNYLTKLIAQGIRNNEFRADLDPQAAAAAVMGVINGVTVTWLIAPASFSIKKKASAIATTLLQGMG